MLSSEEGEVAVYRRLQHAHSCGDQQQSNICVNRKEEFTTTVGLHSTHTKETANVLCTAR
jgi:hypothetical protein